MFSTKYTTHRIDDVSGQQVYKPGVFFEILIDIIFGKSHIFHLDNNGHIYEYPFLAISNWREAFTKTQSPFFGCFVYPIGWLMVKMVKAFGGLQAEWGVLFALFVTSLMVRLITLSFTFKSQLNQDKMQMLQAKQATIQAKYKQTKDPAAKRQAQTEIMQLYRSQGLSPFGPILNSFLALPFLVAMYTVVRATQALKLAHVGQIFLVRGVWHQVTNGYPVYLTLLFVYFPLQLVSNFLPTLLVWKRRAHMSHEQKKAQNKQLIIQGVIPVVFLFVAANIAAGVAIYWIFSSVIQIGQVLFFHWLRIYRKQHQQAKHARVIKSSKVPIMGGMATKRSRAARRASTRALSPLTKTKTHLTLHRNRRNHPDASDEREH